MKKPGFKKRKVNESGKKYPLERSPLYNLKSKKKLSALLGIDRKSLLQLTSSGKPCYREFDHEKTGRHIEEPICSLRPVHHKLATFLRRIETPNYLHSDVCGRSNIDNARFHIDARELYKTDLRSYFPSTTRSYVFDLFYNLFKCSPDVSDALSRLSTVNDHVPTGSQLSSILTFWSNIRLFEDLLSIATEHKCRFTVFVDDLVFSGDVISTELPKQVQRTILLHGRRAKKKKTIKYGQGATKIVTGVAIKNSELLAPNSRLKKYREHRTSFRALSSKDKKIGLKNSMVGQLNSLGAIDEKYKEMSKRIL